MIHNLRMIVGSCSLNLHSNIEYFMNCPVIDLWDWQKVIKDLNPEPETR